MPQHRVSLYVRRKVEAMPMKFYLIRFVCIRKKAKFRAVFAILFSIYNV